MVDSVAVLKYPCNMKGLNEPELHPTEEVYIKVIKVTILDET